MSARRIVIASGKGGTGKTTVAVNLALAAAAPIQLIDCDVEEPNAHLFLPGTVTARHEVALQVPVIDTEACTGCGACAEFCRFNALAVPADRAMVFTELCHACGGCTLVCPAKAISEEPRPVGEVVHSAYEQVELITGRLGVGEPAAPPVIRAAQDRAWNTGTVLVDAPPGTACAAVAAVHHADFVLLVTEPTPFGLNDLALAVEMVADLDRPHAVLINRSDSGDDRVVRWCHERGIPVLAEIPDDRRVAEAYARGIPAVEAVPELRAHFAAVLAALAHDDPTPIPPMKAQGASHA